MSILHGIVPEPWMAESLCAQTDPEEFYPEKGGSTRLAKAVCGRCPVREQCLTFALERDEMFGIWGGHSERDRRVLKKDPAALTAAIAAIRAEPAKPVVLDERPAPHVTRRTPVRRQETAMPTIASPTGPDLEVTEYVADMAGVLSRTEGHPDKAVRDVRKIAVQAIQALATLSTSVPASRRHDAPAPKPAVKATSSPTTGTEDTPAATVRTWAKQQGLDCPKVGRVPGSIREAYAAAHSQAAA